MTNRIKTIYGSGFTLIELIIVVSIIGVLTIVSIGTFTASMQRSRDGRRKADLGTIQKGLESYYDINGIYPASTASSDLCASDSTCYLKTTPVDPNGSAYYYTRGNVGGTNQSFQLYSTLERTDDTGTGTGTYSSNCGGQTCRYGVSSTNTTP